MTRWVQYPMMLIQYRLADILRGRFGLPHPVSIAENPRDSRRSSEREDRPN